MHSINK